MGWLVGLFAVVDLLVLGLICWKLSLLF